MKLSISRLLEIFHFENDLPPKNEINPGYIPAPNITITKNKIKN